LPYDFAIEDLNIIVEIDGEQHFAQISNWTSPEIQIEKDKYKMKCANENGFSVIRLLQIDIAKDKFDWLDEIKLSILKIINEKLVQNIFICKNNEYKIFN
jgi:very-short-patch-repair endonuclease